MSFSHLGRYELAALTQKMCEAAKEINKDDRREELKRKLLLLEGKLSTMGDSEQVAVLQEKISSLSRTINHE